MPNRKFPTFLVAALLVSAAPALGQGKVPLSEEPHINEQLIAAAAGDQLRLTCPSLSVRVFVVWGKILDLENYARSKGYDEAEVRAFLKDPAQKARIAAAAQAYLTKAGIVAGNVDSYCRAGRNEIAQRTPVGSLLRASE